MDKLTFNIGIIGCGNVADKHAEAISQISDAQISAVCSGNVEKAKAFAKKLGVPRVYDNYMEMLEDKDIDIVDILTPSGMHAEMAINAARHNKHVIVEKPIDIDLSSAYNMVRICGQSGVKLSVIFQHRMDDSSQILKQYIDEGKLGKLVLGDAHIKWFRSQEYYDSGLWRGTRKLDGGGVLINQGIHTIDLLLYMMGEAESVQAYCSTLDRKIEVEDTAAGAIKFKNGALGTIIGTTCAYPGMPAALEINGTEGSARIEGDRLVLLEGREIEYNNKNEDDSKLQTGASDPNGIDCKSHKLQIQDMINAIRENREPLINGYDGIRALEVVLAIYESSNSGKEINLEQFRKRFIRE